MRNQLENIVAGEAITAPALVYFDGVDGKAYLASAATTDHPAQAIVLVDCTEGGDGQAYFSGEVDYSFGSVSKGTPLYLSETAGEITDTAPTNVQQAGFVLSSTTAMFNFQAFAGGVDGGGGGASYLVYTALLSQSGTSAPTATVLENTLGGTVVWTYYDVGQYVATLSGAFSGSFWAPNGVIKDAGYADSSDWFFSMSKIDSNSFLMTTGNANSGLSDGILTSNSNYVEIRVYP